MKSFAVTFLAMFLAAALVMSGYHRFVLAPRLDRAGEAARVSLDDARVQAQQIADGLDASVDRSIADAKVALDAQAASEEARRQQLLDDQKARIQAADVLVRLQMFKVAMAEHRMTTGAWPVSLAEMGLAAAAAPGDGPIASVALEPHGVLVARLRESVAAGGIVRLVPRADAAGGVSWSCVPSGYDEMARFTPGCSP